MHPQKEKILILYYTYALDLLVGDAALLSYTYLNIMQLFPGCTTERIIRFPGILAGDQAVQWGWTSKTKGEGVKAGGGRDG